MESSEYLSGFCSWLEATMRHLRRDLDPDYMYFILRSIILSPWDSRTPSSVTGRGAAKDHAR